MDNFVVGLAGAHSTGKSTIINAIKALGLPVDETQLSRTAQAALGWDHLKYAQESQENMWALQDAILQAMEDRDKRINDSKIFTLVDRTPADVWGYTKLWISRIGEENVDMIRFQNYQHKCFTLAERYYRQIIVPIRDEIPFVEEPNRADAKSRLFHGDAVYNFIVNLSYPHYILQTVSVEDRVNEVKAFLKKRIF